MSGCGLETRMKMVQQKLPYKNGGHDPERERNSRRGTGALQAHPASTESNATNAPLMKEVVQEETLVRAWRAVRKNQGGPGVDGMTIEAFESWWPQNRQRIVDELLAGTYQPQPVKRVEIPKPKGGVRVLGVPTVLDRVVQQAIVQVLTPIFDPGFSEHSYGFRPGRSAHGAVLAVREFAASGFRWVVDVDLKAFFDHVNHDVLMGRLAKRLDDPTLLRLIRRFLRAGMMAGGVVSVRTAGTPQGGPLSPLLSNVLLDEWDKELERRGHHFARYADDCNIYVQSKRAGERVLASCRRFLEQRLRLIVNEEKSTVARPSTRTFLGYSLTAHRSPKLRLGPDSVKRLKDRLRETLRRTRGRSLKAIVFELNQYLRGWLGYFRLIETPSVLKKLQSWIQRKLRCYRIKQLRRATKLFWELKRLGVPAKDLVWLLSTSRGPWRLSRNPQVHQGFGPRYWASLGLFNLPTSWRSFASAT